jgi:UDP-glucose 4-epimerase
LLALRYLRSRGAPLTLNCGYGHGFSVREVIETVKRVSGIDFEVANAPRREGDPARIVAASARIVSKPSWPLRKHTSLSSSGASANLKRNQKHTMLSVTTQFGMSHSGFSRDYRAANAVLRF